MKPAIETITVTATNPGAGAAGVVVAGNSLTIRDSRAKAYMLSPWSTRAAAGFSRFLSPLMHDNVNGVQFRQGIGQSVGQGKFWTPMYAQDALTTVLAGSGAAIEHSSFSVFYEDLPGVSGYFIDSDELERRTMDLMSVFCTVVPGTTAYGTQVAINATQDQFKANTDYAVMGMTTQAGVATTGTHAVRIISSDFGNLGVAIPAGGSAVPAIDIAAAEWFARLAEWTRMTVIPVFNSSNKALTFVDAIGAAATSTTVSILLARLSAKKGS